MITYFANPARFEKSARICTPVFAFCGLILWAYGLYQALIISPPDYQQGETVRIMYIHVPSAWIALFLYTTLSVCGVVFLVWRHILAGLALRAIAPVGATMTAICLITGSLWGQPMWGTWWVWDARLTSVLILFFLYIGIIALERSFENRDRGLQAASWLAIIGFINIPIIKFSVEWWNTLHQPSSISSFKKLKDPALDASMLEPLLLMTAAGFFLTGALILYRVQTEILTRKQDTR